MNAPIKIRITSSDETFMLVSADAKGITYRHLDGINKDKEVLWTKEYLDRMLRAYFVDISAGEVVAPVVTKAPPPPRAPVVFDEPELRPVIVIEKATKTAKPPKPVKKVSAPKPVQASFF